MVGKLERKAYEHAVFVREATVTAGETRIRTIIAEAQRDERARVAGRFDVLAGDAKARGADMLARMYEAAAQRLRGES